MKCVKKAMVVIKPKQTTYSKSHSYYKGPPHKKMRTRVIDAFTHF